VTRITAIRELPVGLRVDPSGGPANAVVNFSNHTVSPVAVLTDTIRDGKPVVGGIRLDRAVRPGRHPARPDDSARAGRGLERKAGLAELMAELTA